MNETNDALIAELHAEKAALESIVAAQAAAITEKDSELAACKSHNEIMTLRAKKAEEEVAAIGAGGVSLMGQSAMPADAELPGWVVCQSRRPYVLNSLKARAQDMRSIESRCRTAYRKDFMNKPSQYLADAYGEAAAVFESRLAAIARRRIEGE